MKLKIFLIILLIPLVIYSQDDKYLPSLHNGVLVRHQNYVLSYVEQFEGAEWVAYELTYPETKNNVERKTGEFLNDDSVKTHSALHKDYTNSGYDRGHLAPAGDMNFSLDAMLESFYMSNILPQTAELNRKTWKYLEDDIRYYVMNNKSHLYIICGGVFTYNGTCIGIKNKVAVPKYFYKIVYDDSIGKSLAFIMPNVHNPNTNYFYYVTSIDSIESYTGIDFFTNVSIDDTKIGPNWLKK